MAQETCEVKVRRGENIDRALRRLKKELDKEGILKTMRSKRFYEKPSEKRIRLAKLSPGSRR
jgi:small subunit ribosomal protein S21